jgi:hypothetical protein
MVSIRRGDNTYRRAKCSFEDGKLIFRFDKAQTTVVVGVAAKPKYFVFRIESVATEKLPCGN